MATDDSIDYSQFEQDAVQERAAVPQEAVADMTVLGEQLVSKQQKILQLKLQLEAEEKALRTLATETIVNAMDSANCGMFKTKDGQWKIEIKDLLEGSFPSATKKPEQYAAACAWLRENGHDDLLKRYLTFTFPKGGTGKGDDFISYDQICDAVKQVALEQMRELGMNNPTIEDEVTVHHMTLKSWAREMKEDGVQIPAETLGLWVGRIAKVEKC